MRVSRAEFALIGALVAVEEGRAIASSNHIPSPAGDMALQLARAFAEGHNARLEPNPILVADRFSLSSAQKGGVGQDVRYIVDVSSVNITILYAILDWTSFDIAFSSHVKIYDVKSGRVIAQSSCLVRGDHSDHFSHDTLLANGAANLKMLIKKRGDQCVAKHEADLGLSGAPALQIPVEPPEIPYVASYQGAAAAAPVETGFSSKGEPIHEPPVAQDATAAPTPIPSARDEYGVAAPVPALLPTRPPDEAAVEMRRVIGIKVLADGTVQETYGP
jgi:hypothetical protein